MEDYIEMIYRINKENIKITELASLLNIKASSVSKMIEKLKDLNLVEKEKYGEINLTNSGEDLGKYLLKRHNILCKFFNIITPLFNIFSLRKLLYIIF